MNLSSMKYFKYRKAWKTYFKAFQVFQDTGKIRCLCQNGSWHKKVVIESEGCCQQKIVRSIRLRDYWFKKDPLMTSEFCWWGEGSWASPPARCSSRVGLKNQVGKSGRTDMSQKVEELTAGNSSLENSINNNKYL